MTDRRAFIGALISGLVVAPLVSLAQQPAKVHRIGVIGERSDTDPFVEAFRQGLRDLGYREGQTFIIEFRSTSGVQDRIPALARELIRLPVDVIVVGGSIAAKQVKAETTTVPIVFATAGDPVGTGLVTSLARPGGNATGMSNLQSELGAKQLELLKAVAPRIARVAVMYNPGSLIARGVLIGVVETARVLSIELQWVEVRQPEQLAGALSALAPKRAEALLVLSDPVFGSQLARIAQLAGKQRLPAVYARREFAEAGGLLAYGPNFVDNYRRAATYVDKILKGASPASLPVEQPTKFELVINLKTAKSLGLTIPQSLLLRADEVVE